MMKPVSRPVKATYLIETAFALEQAAEIMAGEQSCGTFVKTPGETDALRHHHAAEVVLIEELGEVASPSLPDARLPKGKGKPVFKRAKVTLAWPFENMGANLPVLASTIAGNLYELAPFSGLKLLDIEVPPAFKEKYPGPKFGITGTRQLAGVSERPIIGTIIKPSVGLSPEATAQQVKTLLRAGLDFIKDDELMGDSPHSPFKKRVEAVMEVINEEAERSGKKAMYAFNLSGDMEDMLRRHDFVVAQGGTCVMVNINHVGLSAVNHLRNYSQLPLHGHRNGWGAIYRCEALGMEFPAYQKLWRLAGVDQLHTNGIRNKFCESDASVIRSVKACLQPFPGETPIFPVISSGQWADQAHDTFQAIQSTDVMYLCGGGITAHPGGMEAGVRSLQIAWEGALRGKTVDDLAALHPEIAEAIAFFRK